MGIFRVLNLLTVLLLSFASVNAFAINWRTCFAWLGGKNHSVENIDSSVISDQVQAKVAIKPSREAKRDLADFESLSDPEVINYLQTKLSEIYRLFPTIPGSIENLLVLTGTPVQSKWVAALGGSGSVFQTDFPLRLHERMAQAVGPIQFESTAALASQLNLNREGIRESNGLIVLTERSGSTSGMGITDKGLHHPGLADIMAGKVPGFSAVEIKHSDPFSSGSVWGGRYSSTTEYALYPIDPQAFKRMKDHFPFALIAQADGFFRADSISDSKLNAWLEMLGSTPVNREVSYHLNTRDSKNPNGFDVVSWISQNGQQKFNYNLRQFLFLKGTLNFRPMTIHYEEAYSYTGAKRIEIKLDPATFTSKTKILHTKDFFPVDKVYYRPVRTGKGVEVFGHLEATSQALNTHDIAAVRSFLLRILGDTSGAQFEVSQVVLADEGQFSAVVTRK